MVKNESVFTARQLRSRSPATQALAGRLTIQQQSSLMIHLVSADIKKDERNNKPT